MYDKNGKAIGVLGHEVKTHVTDTDNEDMIASLNKDLYSVKINDRFSNVVLLSYSNPTKVNNNHNILADSLDTAHHVKKFSDSKSNHNKEEKFNISSMPNTSNTGLMH